MDEVGYFWVSTQTDGPKIGSDTKNRDLSCPNVRTIPSLSKIQYHLQLKEVLRDNCFCSLSDSFL